MSLQKIRGDVFGDDGFVGFQGIGVARAHFGGDFEGDVEELAEVEVVGGVALIVAEGGLLYTFCAAAV